MVGVVDQRTKDLAAQPNAAANRPSTAAGPGALDCITRPRKNMHATDLAINQTLGMQLAPEDCGHLLEMPESPLLLNHVGTVHASVQFALAEACSGEFLLRHLGDMQSRVFAVLRTSDEVPQAGPRRFACFGTVCLRLARRSPWQADWLRVDEPSLPCLREVADAIGRYDDRTP